jgi:CAAX prenyl protease-like protein
MTFAQRVAFFGVAAGPASPSTQLREFVPKTDKNPVLIYLAPFAALMAGQILTQAAAPHDYLFYPAKVAAVAAVLFSLRSVYARMWLAPDLVSILLGGVAGAIWIATDPGAGTHTPLGASLSEFTPIALAVWLVFRAVGSIIMVPIAEELAFRGYLYRALLSSRFESVDFRAFGFVALIISSALFGMMHDRWLAAFLAGALYAFVMVRRGKITDAIAAHMTTNAVIFAWAVCAGQWSLL